MGFFFLSLSGRWGRLGRAASTSMLLAWAGCTGIADERGALPDGGGNPQDSSLATDASTMDSGTSPDGSTGVDGGALTAPLVLLPAADSEVLFSAAVKVAAPTGTAYVVVTAASASTSCRATAPELTCLLDLSGASTGAIELALEAFGQLDESLGSSSHRVVRRDAPTPCTGNTDQLTDCVVARAMAGSSAGFTGVTYINADDRHALVNTSRMTGIDARVLSVPPVTVLADVEMGVMNESRAFTPSGGTCALTRCGWNGRTTGAINHYEADMLFFHPEHRDVGFRDYFQFQGAFAFVSQGSSGSERDEATKALQALGVLDPTARSKAKQEGAIGPLLSLLLVRSRVSSDVAYLTPDAHPTAFNNASNATENLRLAAAVHSSEVPPVAKLTVSESIPDSWNTFPGPRSAYAVGFSPSLAPSSAPPGRFSIEVDLSESYDPNDRPLLFFPVVLRGGSDVTVEYLREGVYAVSGPFPSDFQMRTGGQDRTVSRFTVGFFPHNGVWLGAPVTVSVGAQPRTELAPGTNELN